LLDVFYFLSRQNSILGTKQFFCHISTGLIGKRVDMRSRSLVVATDSEWETCFQKYRYFEPKHAARTQMPPGYVQTSCANKAKHGFSKSNHTNAIVKTLLQF